ncbi:MAG TPA: hypothetical protein VJ201_03250 [Candidatus Babeliales bacterium]|nr:hypothetical protein [Candidatus Babeliales bacterium]
MKKILIALFLSLISTAVFAGTHLWKQIVKGTRDNPSVYVDINEENIKRKGDLVQLYVKQELGSPVLVRGYVTPQNEILPINLKIKYSVTKLNMYCEGYSTYDWEALFDENDNEIFRYTNPPNYIVKQGIDIETAHGLIYKYACNVK